LIRNNLTVNKQFRFNSDRVKSFCSNNPEFQKLVDLSTNGVIIDQPSDFCLQTSMPPLRPLHIKLLNVIRFLGYKSHLKGKAILLPYDVLQPSEISKIHISQTHWTPKPSTTITESSSTKLHSVINPGCLQGRMLIDPSNGSPLQVLNTPETKQLAINRYGKTIDPLITTLIQSWYTYINTNNYTLQDCRIYKDDIVFAFGQLQFNVDSSFLMIQPIDQVYILIYLFGNLGWTGLPMAWGLVKRSILFLALKLINGTLDAYVDDFIGFSHLTTASSDQSTLHKCINNILGDDTIQLDKSVPPSTITDVLGWNINLLTETIRPSDKGIDKLLFAFFFVDIRKPQTLKTYQLLASLAERYSLAILGMRPFVAPLHSMLLLGTNKLTSWSKLPSSQARFCIEIWRLISLQLWSNPNYYPVHLKYLTSFHTSTSTIKVISDAGPTQICSAIYNSDNTLQCYTKVLMPFADPDNKYQNIREYIGLLLCLILLNINNTSTLPTFITWITDSTTALSWAECNKVKCLAGQSANIATIWFLIYSGFHLSNTQHIPGLNMECIDRASRNEEISTDFINIPFINLQDNIHVNNLLTLCDPTITSQNCIDHHDLYCNIHCTLRSLFLSFK